MAADGMVTQGAEASAAMIVNYSSLIILVCALGEFFLKWINPNIDK